MKPVFLAVLVAAVCCVSCVEIDYSLGSNMVSASDKMQACVDTVHIKDICVRRADSLSGYSTRKIVIGAIRDDLFGLSSRSASFALIPMYDTLDFGSNPVVKRFHFSVKADSISVNNLSDAHILQNVYVYELDKPIKPLEDYDCNAEVAHGSVPITYGIPVINGTDSLSFDFTREYGQKFLDLAKDGPYVPKEMDDYLKRIPGICIETEEPYGNGGRFNLFDLQLGFDVSQMMLTGNLASLTINSLYPEISDERFDTTFFFYLGADKFYNVDSLLTNVSWGNYPQYCLNSTYSEEKALEYKGDDLLFIEGGGGIKPVIDGRALRRRVRERILDTLYSKGLDSTRIGEVVINKATLELPFEYPGNDRIMYRYPDILSPTLRSYVTKTVTLSTGEEKTYKVRAYASLTDSSSSTENQGDINRNPISHSDATIPGDVAVMSYKPDITYYVQSLMALKDNNVDLLNGGYDIWLMIQAYETITTGASISSVEDANEYYQYLAYQSYYNSMYNSSYSDYYSNYYSYMLAAQYASGSTNTTTSVMVQLDKDRYYKAVIRGKCQGGDNACVPCLRLIFSIPEA